MELALRHQAKGRCRQCLLPAAAPGADLDATGVCAFCRAGAPCCDESARKTCEADLEQALQACRGQGAYDCLVNLSGGKDSCYLLYKLKVEYKLRVLAFTTNINIPDVAQENIRRTVEQLGVDHISYTPPVEFYRKMFRFLLRNQEGRGAVRTVCYVCAPLFEGYSLRVALEKQIPLVLAGYSPGQPEPERMVYEFSREIIHSDWSPPELAESGLFSPAELELFWNAHRYPAGTQFPRYLAPFHAWEYSQAEVMRKVVELGLIRNSRHASPVHSNCPVNWLLMYSDLRHLGYNPYAPEFSALIRNGKASRRYWQFMMPLLNWMIRRRVFLGRQVTQSLRWLGMSQSDLKVTRPAGDGEKRIALPLVETVS